MKLHYILLIVSMSCEGFQVISGMEKKNI
jgi:hypothetical protein